MQQFPAPNLSMGRVRCFGRGVEQPFSTVQVWLVAKCNCSFNAFRSLSSSESAHRQCRRQQLSKAKSRIKILISLIFQFKIKDHLHFFCLFYLCPCFLSSSCLIQSSSLPLPWLLFFCVLLPRFLLKFHLQTSQ